MKRKIVIATMNDHKASEIRTLIGDRYDVMTQSSFSIPSVHETGKTFEENALIIYIYIYAERERGRER